MEKLMFGFRVYEMVPSYPTGSHPLEVYGEGSPLSDMGFLAMAKMSKLSERTGHDYFAEFYEVCGMCKGWGVKPGCKKKMCPDCGRKGVKVFSVHKFEAKKEGV